MDDTDVCAVYMGLPEKRDGKTVDEHYEKLVKAAKGRPGLTDSLEALCEQAEAYIADDGEDVGVNVMIDGAMFLLDYSTPRCKDFSTVLSCSWFNEVQCYSDRDQMSFPYVLTRALGKLSHILIKQTGASAECVLRRDPAGRDGAIEDARVSA
eukprot:scaffold1213_cov256-Pinguiococcus_pyrenoidosus.AAC.8